MENDDDDDEEEEEKVDGWTMDHHGSIQPPSRNSIRQSGLWRSLLAFLWGRILRIETEFRVWRKLGDESVEA